VTRVLYALGRWCAAHAVLVLVLWLALLGGARLADRVLPPPALDPFVLAGTDSAAAQTLLNRAFPGAASEPVPLVMTDEADLTTEAGAGTVAAVAEAVAGVTGVNGVRGPEEQPDLASADGRTVILQLTMAERAAADKVVGEEVLTTARQAAEEASPTARVALGGYLGQQISRTDTRPSEALGLALAVLVLLFTLRRGWPVVIPLATAVVAVGIGLAVISLLGRLVYIPDEAPTLGTMLGLGVGIDYALFLVTRHRNMLRRGFSVTDSVGRTAGTAGAGMVFAGATLLAAVMGLSLTGISFLAWLGYSAAIVVALALLAALTLVPALMGLMGHRVLRRADQQALAVGAGGEGPDVLTGAESDEELDRGGWARLANTVTGRPWPWAIAATAVLLVMAAPMLTMTFQQVDATALPDDTPAHQAYVMISDGFGPGYAGPLAVVGQLHRTAEAPGAEADPDTGPEADPDPAAEEPADAAGEGDPRTRDARLTAVSDDLAATPGIAEVGDPVVSTDGGVVIWRAIPSTGSSDKATEALVHELRTTVLPQATDGADMTAYVGGVTAARTDLSLRIADRLLPFILGVASFSFLLLMVAYRSLVIPLKAAAMNLLSISAAYGVVVAIFQWGWGAGLIGLDGPVPIESYVPMMMFAVLFGLSMDYEVFLLTAFTEHYQRTGDITTAVRRGLADTGQLITAAALIMVVVFASFILPDNAVVKMFGVGLATAVLVDATIVRCILVPSLMVLAARWTWWLPAWLDRALPHLHVEGDPAQLETVGGPRPVQPADARPGAGPLALVGGALAGWVVGALVATAGAPTIGAAIALAAASGAALAYLPRSTRGADGLLWVRLVMMAAGAIGSAALYLLVGGLTPATEQNALLQSGVALLVPLALVALTPLRRFSIPLGMGILAMVAAMAAGDGLTLDVVALPALTAALVTRLAGLIGRAIQPGDRPERVDGVPDPTTGGPATEGPAAEDPAAVDPATEGPADAAVTEPPTPVGSARP
jgi:RND superfamily putative drug exporter